MIWMNRFPIILPSAKSASAMAWTSFDASQEAIVQRCQEANLVWGKELYFDSTQVNANADLDSLAPRFAIEAREAIQRHRAALFAQDHQVQQEEERRQGLPLPRKVFRPCDLLSSSAITSRPL
jgi:hypothetical protein